MQNRILFISTSNELTELARKISKELGIDMHIHEGGIMKNGHIYAKQNERKYDVIVSQGGTAEAVKKLVSIPVVSIEIRFIDFLDAIYKAKQFGDRIGLVTYMREDIKDLERIKTILNIDFQVFPYRTKEEMKKQIEDATAMGKLTLIGMGDCILETTKLKNLNGIVIQTGEKQVREAIIAAKNIYSLSLREKEKAERFKAILDHSTDGIIVLDKNDVITIFNPAAEKIFDISADQVLNRSIKNNINRKYFCNIYGDGKYQLNKLVKVKNKQIVLNRVPIMVGDEQRGLVMTFQEISQIQKLEQKVRTELYKKGLVAKYNFDDIIGESKLIKDTINQAKKIGRTSSTIMLTGETGTGKELFAQSIHNISHRKDGPFVAINCAALPENLLESELFGYEEGAFTGAKKGGKIGMFELAHGGTIFLDEVGEIPLSLQGRLLRVLQEREVLRVGGDYIFNVDIRVIAATNVDLYQKVKEGKFREDLYFRLNVLDLRIPSLRERKEDIPLLVMNFIQEMNTKHGTKIKDITDSAMELIKEYDWPGNIRQLQNFTEKMCILSNTSVINESLVRQLLNLGLQKTERMNAAKENRAETITLDIRNIKDIELQIIKEASKVFKGNKTLLAEKLGMSRTTLWKRLKEIEAME